MPDNPENTPDIVSSSPDPNIEAEKPAPVKKKGGRPVGAKNKPKHMGEWVNPNQGGRPEGSGQLQKKRRQYQYSLMERIRERLDPDIVIDWYEMILEGKHPVLQKSPDGNYKIIPDPSPLAQSPTLADKQAAMKALQDRGYGLPSQSITVDAEFKTKVEMQLTGITSELLANFTPQSLQMIRQALALPDPNIVDAEIIEEPTTNSPTIINNSEA